MTARKSIVAVTVLAMSLTSSVTHAMSGYEHLKGAKLLLKTAPERGGAAGLTAEELQKIQQWMDNPSQQTGQYINHTTGQLVNPRNHGNQRHNPVAPAKVFSGNGTVDLATKNVARLHKIQDVATNTAGLDGYPHITDRMRSEAKRILEDVRKTHRLPEKLPDWVDAPGPLTETSSVDDIGRGVQKAGRKIAESTNNAVPRRTYSPHAGAVGASKQLSRMAGNAAKVAGPAGILVEGALRGKNVYDTERAYKKGAITNEARVANHSANAGGMVGGASGAAAGAWAGAACGAVGGPVGVVVGGIVGAIAGGFAGDRAGTNAGTFLYKWLK